jgi:methionine-rich copper-binding protein CopC
MPTFTGNARDNLWLIIEPGNVTIDGKEGRDTVEFGTSLRESYNIYRTEDGAVHVDSISGASGSNALLKSTLYNIEVLTFDSKRDVVDLATLFGDIKPPVVSISDDSPGVANGPVTYTLNFSEPINGLAAASLSVTQGNVLALSGAGATWQVVVVPPNNAVGTIGFMLKSAGVIDTAGNPNAETIAALQAFDTQSPVLLSGNPARGETGIELNANIVLNFSEVVNRGSGTLTLRDAAGVAVETFDVATSARLTLAGAALTIDPSRELAPGTAYSVVFASGSLRDAAGNTLAGNGLAPYSFTSAPASTASALMGTRGNDSFTPGAAVKTVDGFAGIDTTTLVGSSSGYTLSSSAGTFKVNALDGTRKLELHQVERLVFDNQKLAIDLDGNAGTVAKILGAVFGPGSVQNAAYVGIGLNLLDAGVSYLNLMQLALDVRLGANASHGAVVDLLYTNVIGSPPSKESHDSFVALLDNASFTPASLGVLAADTDFNKIAIDLVGLTQTGLPFVPV